MRGYSTGRRRRARRADRRSSRGSADGGERAVDRLVVVDHALDAEALLDVATAGGAVDGVHAFDGVRELLDRVDHEARAPGLDELGNRAAWTRDDRCPTRHRLD